MSRSDSGRITRVLGLCIGACVHAPVWLFCADNFCSHVARHAEIGLGVVLAEDIQGIKSNLQPDCKFFSSTYPNPLLHSELGK